MRSAVRAVRLLRAMQLLRVMRVMRAVRGHVGSNAIASAVAAAVRWMATECARSIRGGVVCVRELSTPGPLV
jgi:hypothetical protein